MRNLRLSVSHDILQYTNQFELVKFIKPTFAFIVLIVSVSFLLIDMIYFKRNIACRWVKQQFKIRIEMIMHSSHLRQALASNRNLRGKQKCLPHHYSFNINFAFHVSDFIKWWRGSLDLDWNLSCRYRGAWILFPECFFVDISSQLLAYLQYSPQSYRPWNSYRILSSWKFTEICKQGT